ncbi:MAG: HAD family phosphatase [Ginsengibacter sp.]
MQKIKAIIFDLGGVLLDIDFKKISASFNMLGVDKFDEIYSQHKSDLVFENLEIGKISEEEFCNVLKKYTIEPVTNEDVTKAWNSILLEFRVGSLTSLKQLKKKYKLFLLSNTNSIHQVAFYKIFENTVEEGSFNSLFDKTYYSHEIGLRKPDATAYQYVLKENNLEPQETLFIDDTPGNIEGAKAVGMPTILLTKEMKIENLGL